jgi:hypothetical protein
MPCGFVQEIFRSRISRERTFSIGSEEEFARTFDIPAQEKAKNGVRHNSYRLGKTTFRLESDFESNVNIRGDGFIVCVFISEIDH